MTLATGTLTYDIGNLLGVVVDATRARIWIETNLPDGDAIVAAADNQIRLGTVAGTASDGSQGGIGSDGKGSFVGLPLSSVIDGLQYQVHVAYPEVKGAGTWDSGWFTFSASGDLADQDMESTAAPITWQSAFITQMQTYADEAQAAAAQAHDISSISVPDDIVMALVNDTSSETRTALAAAFVLLSKIGSANGVASLDPGGKIPVSQLPSSLMQYQGLWNASTNIPAIVDGTGDPGDVYLVQVAGTQNLGSGSLSFVVGDWVIYNGSAWEQARAGADAVQSVAGLAGAITASALKTALGLSGAPLARVAYAPASSSTLSASTTLARVDATNLKITFTAPASGNVRVALEGSALGAASAQYNWSIQDSAGTNLVGTERGVSYNDPGGIRVRTEIPVSGLTPGTSYTWYWAHRLNTGTGGIQVGGTEFSGTYRGPAVMEVWAE